MDAAFMVESGTVRTGVGVAVVCLLLLVTGSLAVAETASSAGHGDCRPVAADRRAGVGSTVPADESVATVTVRRAGPEAVRLTYRDIANVSSEYGPTVPSWLRDVGLRVQSADGFAIYRSENGTSLVWNRSVAEPQVTLRTAPPAGSGGLDAAGATITPEWAILPLPSHSHPTNVTLAADQSGVVGDQVLMLGAHRTVRREAGCQEVVLHLPDAVSSAEDPQAVADSIAAASRSLDVGWRYETVRFFGVGEPIASGGRTLGHEAWVMADTRFDEPLASPDGYPPQPPATNTWLHHYVHTRQGWLANGSATPATAWLTEAVPAYYSVEETARLGLLGRCDATAYWHAINRTLHRGPGQGNLSRPRTYRQVNGAYTQGAYALAALDARIRLQTAGLRSLDDLLVRLNREEQLTADAFEAALVDTAGPGARTWIDRFVSGREIPAPPPRPPECWTGDLDRGTDPMVVLGTLLVLAVIVGFAAAVRWRTGR